MYFVKEGVVSFVYSDDIEGVEDIPFFPLTKGTYFGDIDLIFEQSRKFTVIAETDVELFSMSDD